MRVLLPLVRLGLQPGPARAAPPVRSRRARARRSVLTGVLLAAAVFIGCAAALDACPVVRHPEYGYKLEALRQLRREEPSRPLVVVVGSSRTRYAVNPGAMGFVGRPGEPLVFNFGVGGAHPVNFPMTLRAIFGDGVRPDAVVVEVFPALLHFDDPAQMGYASHGEGLTTAELLAVAPDVRDRELFKRWRRARLNAWHPFERHVIFHLAPRWLPPTTADRFRRAVPDRFGYFSPEVAPVWRTTEVRQRASAVARHQYELCCARLVPSPLAVRSYRELVAECRAAGIPVALYLSPESDAFHGWYTPEARQRLAGFVRMCREELGCPVFDASRGWSEDDFLDGHHMLAPGAARFSRRFADEHLRPWFATTFPTP